MLQLLIDPWIFPLQRIHCDCHQAAPEASNKGLKAKDLDCLLSTENYGLLFIWHVEFQNTATSSLPCRSSKSDCLGSLGRRIYISLPLNKESSLVRHKQIMRTCNTHQWCQQSWESPQEERSLFSMIPYNHIGVPVSVTAQEDWLFVLISLGSFL